MTFAPGISVIASPEQSPIMYSSEGLLELQTVFSFHSVLPATHQISSSGTPEMGEAVGEDVGEAVVGEAVGEDVGEAVVGEAVVGEAVGEDVGEAVVGEAVVGEAVVGEAVVGEAVVEDVGEAVVGEAVVGEAVVEDVGEAVVGEDVGAAVGDDVGELVGESVSSATQNLQVLMQPNLNTEHCPLALLFAQLGWVSTHGVGLGGGKWEQIGSQNLRQPLIKTSHLPFFNFFVQKSSPLVFEEQSSGAPGDGGEAAAGGEATAHAGSHDLRQPFMKVAHTPFDTFFAQKSSPLMFEEQ